jgi:uncharacterized protein
VNANPLVNASPAVNANPVINNTPTFNNINRPIIVIKSTEDAKSDDQLLTMCVKSSMQSFPAEIVDQLLDKAIHDSVSLSNSLVTAAKTGNITCAEALLKAGASPNAATAVWGKSTPEETPLLAAIQSNNLNMVKLLIDGGADVNLRGLAVQNEGVSPLAASAFGDEKIFDLLLESGADVNAPNSNNLTALVEAVMVGKKNLVAKLVQKGADKNIVESIGHEKPIEIAKEKGYTEIVKLLE